MTLFEALLEQYGTNEPILSTDITFECYSRPWIMKQLQTLCEEGKIIRYEKGIYYIPTDTVFGKSILKMAIKLWDTILVSLSKTS